jgi:DNA-directed RNA polymerase subunit RPC12/RpoP
MGANQPRFKLASEEAIMMLRDQNCINCRKILFRQVSPDGKCWLMNDETRLDFESDETDHFYKCPHCGAKNIVAMVGPHQGEIISCK